MANEIERLLPRHYTIMDLAMGGNGPKEIAQVLEMTPQAISGIMNSPIFQDSIAKRRDAMQKEMDSNLAMVPNRAKELLDASSYKAAAKHVELVDHPDARIAQKSASEILDRVFGDQSKQHSPTVIIEAGAIVNLQLALEESKNARNRMKEVA